MPPEIHQRHAIRYGNKIVITFQRVHFDMISSEKVGLQSKGNFGERVLSIFLAKILAVIFDFNGAEGWGEKQICTKGVSESENITRG